MTVFLYVLNTLSDWEIGYITAELSSARFLDKKCAVKLTTVGNTTDPIKTMGGLTINPDMSIDQITFEADDVLILPGADTWLDGTHQKILGLIPHLLKQNTTVAAVCGATLALATTGVLNNKKHTSNDKTFLKMSIPDYCGENLYMDEPAVTDGNLITATGLAPIEFSYEVFKKINAFKPETLEAWYQLNKTRNPKYFHQMMGTLNGNRSP